ncbi:AGE family epimerase/isomerase [Flavihumibacter petaseus]|uniref:Putative sugar isomerase n=1 Tax=Flavihumibacter petaseus NBRC 106054 TaxID=1220578 RepID=A0A0E9N832_9BACT|nr:AGE family epimerase/isomerase [Flavihumibacter petaseus]GAO45535.1 putative sugar isomerase [Flavihumibacter petaseus NBRC 106054]
MNFTIKAGILLTRLIPCFLFFPVSAQFSRNQIADQMERSINTELLNKWYPRNFDTVYGGYLSTYTFDFKPTGAQDKFIVTQARHMWTNAKAALHNPQQKVYRQGAVHGFRFLRDVMWDKTYGGFYSLVNRQGQPISGDRPPKEAYGNAFAIYALAAYYELTRDPEALDLAKKTFTWLEQHSHDPKYLGYFQFLDREGNPMIRTAETPSTSELGYKDQNSSIHLLEAFTDLYHLWKDPLLEKRLRELLVLIRDRITNEKGNLVLFFYPDWTPLSYRDSSRATIMKHHFLDHVSPGHDIETAYLLLEASHALGIRNDSVTWKAARKMTNQAIAGCWDKSTGGLFDEGYYFKGADTLTIIADTKNWWAQAEAMNTLLLMADAYPDAPEHYYQRFTQIWEYINTYMIDHTYGDWYAAGYDKSPSIKTALKGHMWKATYHHYRALYNCMERLRSSSNKVNGSL